MDETVLESANWRLKVALYKSGDIFLELTDVTTGEVFRYKIVDDVLVYDEKEVSYIS